MPILDVEIVAEHDPADGLARRIADAAAPVLGAAPGTLWVKLHRLAPGCYAENGPAPPNPVFVSVLKRAAPLAEAAAEHAALAAAVAQVLALPAERVHITYEPPAAGRQSFGGKLVK